MLLPLAACSPPVRLIGDERSFEVDDGANFIFGRSRDEWRKGFLRVEVDTRPGTTLTVNRGSVGIDPRDRSAGTRRVVLLPIPPLVDASTPFPTALARPDMVLGKFIIAAHGGLLSGTTTVERRAVIHSSAVFMFIRDLFGAVGAGPVVFAGEQSTGVDTPKFVYWASKQADIDGQDTFVVAPKTLGDVDWVVLTTAESESKEGECGPYSPVNFPVLSPGNMTPRLSVTWQLTAFDRRTGRSKAERKFPGQGPCPRELIQRDGVVQPVRVFPDRDAVRAWMKSLVP